MRETTLGRKGLIDPHEGGPSQQVKVAATFHNDINFSSHRPETIRFGQQGAVSVMREIGMLPKRRGISARMADPVICQKSLWERASVGGLFIPLVGLGKAVERDQER